MSTRIPHRRQLLAAAAIATAAMLGAVMPGAVASAGVQSQSDVFMRDNPGDTGIEASTGSVYSSPDIKVCANPGCASDQTLVSGAPAWIYVTLNNPGPNGSGPANGTLQLYYTESGTGAQWPAQWHFINQLVNISPPYGSTPYLIHWPSVAPHQHFCLLARWLSAGDPMHVPEGLSTSTNTRNNNNIAWHNVNVVPAYPNHPVLRPIVFDWDGPDPTIGDIVFTQPGKPFVGPGKLIVDLGPELFARWRAGGGKGIGVKQVGETQLQIVSTQQARIQGIAFKPGEQVPAQLSFTAGELPADAEYVVQATLTDARGNEGGGVEYRISAGKEG